MEPVEKNSWGTSSNKRISLMKNMKIEMSRIIVHIFTVAIGLLFFEIIKMYCLEGRIPPCLLRGTLTVFFLSIFIAVFLVYYS